MVTHYKYASEKEAFALEVNVYYFSAAKHHPSL
jgi:hypothetical protein